MNSKYSVLFKSSVVPVATRKVVSHVCNENTPQPPGTGRRTNSFGI